MHPLQRSWDALLILHWRRNNKIGALAVQAKELLGKSPYELAEEGVLRCKGYAHPKMHVRVWVDAFLHPLSVKLWDIDDNKRVLDWVNASTGLDCEEYKKAKEYQKDVYKEVRRNRLHVQQNRLSIEISKLANRKRSPNMVKAVRSKTR